MSSLMPLPCHTPTQTGMGLWLACAKPRSSGAKQKSVLCCWCGAGGQICSHSEPWRLCRYKLCVESAGIAAWLQINYLERTSPQQRPDSICTCGPRERLMPIPLVEAYQHHLRLYTGKTIHSADSESWSLLLAVWCVTCASVLTHWVLVWNRPMLARSTTGGLDSRLQLGPGGAGALPHAICGVQLQATHIEVDGTEGRRHTASYRPRPPRCQHDSPTRCRADARTARSRRGWGGPGWGGPS